VAVPLLRPGFQLAPTTKLCGVGEASTNLSHIGYDLDADVTATPNHLIGVLDPAGPDLRHQGDVREQQRDLQAETSDRRGGRTTFHSQVGADGHRAQLCPVPRTASGGLFVCQALRRWLYLALAEDQAARSPRAKIGTGDAQHRQPSRCTPSAAPVE
jgi:hypothetical protein